MTNSLDPKSSNAATGNAQFAKQRRRYTHTQNKANQRDVNHSFNLIHPHRPPRHLRQVTKRPRILKLELNRLQLPWDSQFWLPPMQAAKLACPLSLPSSPPSPCRTLLRASTTAPQWFRSSIRMVLHQQLQSCTSRDTHLSLQRNQHSLKLHA